VYEACAKEETITIAPIEGHTKNQSQSAREALERNVSQARI
jgi:hypothetical protein